MDTWVAVQGIWDREISHGSPRCTNGTLGRDGHMGLQCRVYGTERHPMLSPRCTNGTLGRDGHVGLQCRVYGTERHPMGVPGVPMVHWDGMDTWDCSVDHDMEHLISVSGTGHMLYMGQRDIPRIRHGIKRKYTWDWTE